MTTIMFEASLHIPKLRVKHDSDGKDSYVISGVLRLFIFF